MGYEFGFIDLRELNEVFFFFFERKEEDLFLLKCINRKFLLVEVEWWVKSFLYDEVEL